MTRTLAPSLIALVLAARVAGADVAPLAGEAKVQYDKGLRLYEAERYAESLPYFQKAYAASRAPEVISTLAQTERLTGQCALALVHYREFLATGIEQSPEGAAALQANVFECWQRLPAAETTAPCPAAPRMVVRDRTPFYRSIAALGLYTGAMGVGVGVAFLIKSSTTRDRANDASYSDDFDSLLDEATGQRRIGVTFLITGGVLAVGGLAYHLVAKRSAAPTTSVSFTGHSISIARAF